MTKEEKKDRRDARHQVQAALKREAIKKLGFYSTGSQIRAGLSTLTDRFYAEQVMPAARRIEDQVILEAGRRASAG